MQAHEFISKIAPAAVSDRERTGIPASLTIAQAALESGWGKSGLTQKANNLFGIKGQGPAGSVLMPTIEYYSGNHYHVTAKFRAYHNWLESITDHSNLILNGTPDNPRRYHNVINAEYKEACHNIASDGYATNPDYAHLLIDLIEQHGLQQYDEHAEPETIVSIQLNGKNIARGKLVNNQVIAPVRIVSEALGATVHWNGRVATVNGQEITASQLINSIVYAPVREVVKAAGGQVTGWNQKERIVNISK